MKKFLSFAAGILACAGLMLAAAPALARSDVSVGINIGVPGIYGAPVYVEPQPRVIYTQPRPLYIQGGPMYYEEPQWEGREHRGRHWKHRHNKHDHDERNWRD